MDENLSSSCSPAVSLLYLFAGDGKPRRRWPVQFGADAEVFRDGAVKMEMKPQRTGNRSQLFHTIESEKPTAGRRRGEKIRG